MSGHVVTGVRCWDVNIFKEAIVLPPHGVKEELRKRLRKSPGFRRKNEVERRREGGVVSSKDASRRESVLWEGPEWTGLGCL